MKAIRPSWMPTSFLSVALVAAMGTCALAEVIRIVSPPSAANAEGSELVTPDRTPIRIQYLIPASEFAGLPATHRRIVAFNFRADRIQLQAVNWTIPHEQVWMSTTSIDSLTTVFDNNHGPNKMLAFDGTMTFPFLATGPAGGPRPFADGTRLQTPFVYDPTLGNLLIELRDLDKNYQTAANIDVAVIPGPNVRTLLNIGNSNGTSGDPISNLFAPLQLEFAVPEPSISLLASLSCLGLIGYRRTMLRRRA